MMSVEIDEVLQDDVNVEPDPNPDADAGVDEVDPDAGLDLDADEGSAVPDMVPVPFQSEFVKLSKQIEDEGKEPRGGTYLRGPKGSKSTGALNDLYAQYKAEPNEANLSLLLVGVGHYAQANTPNFSALNESPTPELYSSLAQEVQVRVWQSLGKFNGRSKFSTWVNRICKNLVKDKYRTASRRKEDTFFEWKDYHDTDVNRDAILKQRGHSYAAASAEHTNANFEVSSTSRTLVEGGAPLAAYLGPDVFHVRLAALLPALTEEEQDIIRYHMAGYSPSSIGREFNRSEKWAYAKIAATVKKLKGLAGGGKVLK